MMTLAIVFGGFVCTLAGAIALAGAITEIRYRRFVRTLTPDELDALKAGIAAEKWQASLREMAEEHAARRKRHWNYWGRPLSPK